VSIVGIALLVALCIPIVAILLDSPVGRALAARLERAPVPAPEDPKTVAELERRMHLLEGDVEILHHTVTQLREETQFLQSLLEENRGRQLPPDRS
jgi:hypothetical protein